MPEANNEQHSRATARSKKKIAAKIIVLFAVAIVVVSAASYLVRYIANTTMNISLVSASEQVLSDGSHPAYLAEGAEKEIRAFFSDLEGLQAEDGLGAGVYRVGLFGEIKPGLYYFGGSQESESQLCVYSEISPGLYSLDHDIRYYGHYLYDLKRGSIVVYNPADASAPSLFRPAPARALSLEAPYQSGCYRVGIDIPHGRYDIAPIEGLADATQSPALYVKQDASLDYDSYLSKYILHEGESEEVYLHEDEYVEAYGVSLTPTE